jgi:hypothetical protein
VMIMIKCILIWLMAYRYSYMVYTAVNVQNLTRPTSHLKSAHSNPLLPPARLGINSLHDRCVMFTCMYVYWNHSALAVSDMPAASFYAVQHTMYHQVCALTDVTTSSSDDSATVSRTLMRACHD